MFPPDPAPITAYNDQCPFSPRARPWLGDMILQWILSKHTFRNSIMAGI